MKYYPNFTIYQTTPDAYIPWRVRNSHLFLLFALGSFTAFELWNLDRRADKHLANVAALKA